MNVSKVKSLFNLQKQNERQHKNMYKHKSSNTIWTHLYTSEQHKRMQYGLKRKKKLGTKINTQHTNQHFIVKWNQLSWLKCPYLITNITFYLSSLSFKTNMSIYYGAHTLVHFLETTSYSSTLHTQESYSKVPVMIMCYAYPVTDVNMSAHWWKCKNRKKRRTPLEVMNDINISLQPIYGDPSDHHHNTDRLS